jgi:hypothetical protein
MTRGLRLDQITLEAALLGLEQKRNDIDAKIGELRAWLGENAEMGAVSIRQKSKRGPMSVAARKRIAAAQRKRWAAYRAAKKH